MQGVQVLRGLDVLRDVEQGRVPAAVARRDKLDELRRRALAIVRDEGLLAPRACWRVAALQGKPGAAGWLDLDGGRLQAPRLVPASGRLTGVACAVLTLGAAVTSRIDALFTARAVSLALALDGVANELLFALSRRVQDRMAVTLARQGLGMAGELRAGDPGLELEAHPAVLELAGAAAIDVRLTSTLMLNPPKSTSIVQGVGLDLPRQTWSRCDDCRTRERCAVVNDPAYRSAPAASALQAAT
ncbi:MAG: hypothetical protein ABS84_17160 [Rubrivivax sp. SCN 71-131]|nr:MAG: hypothetical protein ABS84_17160 [Rubrivivax sp. SCN 71-131]